MKIDIPILAGLLCVITTWLVRAQIHGVEATLVSTAIEFGLRGVGAGSRIIGMPLTKDKDMDRPVGP